MSEKEKRNTVSTEKSDAVRFRDIVKISDDIMKTAYPPEENESEITKEIIIDDADTAEDDAKATKASINPFTEAKAPKGKLSVDLTPDGKILVEDDPERSKRNKEISRDKEKADKFKEKQEKKREKLLARIKELEPRLKEVRVKTLTEEDPALLQKYRKEEDRLSKKINELNQRAVSPEQFTRSSGFYIKARFFKIWVIVLVILVLIIIALSTALISTTYKNMKHYQGDSLLQRESVSALNNEVSSLNNEKDNVTQQNTSLEQEILNLNERIAEIETQLGDTRAENDDLRIKADFLIKHVRIVNGNLFKKTYHIYGCTKADYSSFWAYNKEQVEGKAGYTACSHCIK